MARLDELDPSAPFSFRAVSDLVAWNDGADWHVFDAYCPHLARMGVGGRVEDGCLVCPFPLISSFLGKNIDWFAPRFMSYCRELFAEVHCCRNDEPSGSLFVLLSIFRFHGYRNNWLRLYDTTGDSLRRE